MVRRALRLRVCFVGVLVTGACAGPAPPPTAPRPPVAPTASVPPPTPTPPIEAPVTVLVPLVESPGKEPFFDPAADVAKTYAARTKIVKHGKRWATATATTPAHQVEPEAMFHEAIVADRASNRVRVVCVAPATRVATWIDHGDLATVAKAPIVVAPKPVAGHDPRTPGIHLQAGTIVERKGTEDPAKVRVKTETIDGAGFVAASGIDVVFTPGASSAEQLPLDGEIPKAATFLDAPNGAAVATVAKASKDGATLFVSLLGPAQAGHRLVRYESYDADRPTVVGWVKQADLKVLAHSAPDMLGLIGSGPGGSPYPHKMVKLAKGTRLADPASKTPVGVVTRDNTNVYCVEGCENADALVAVPACAGTLHVRVMR